MSNNCLVTKLKGTVENDNLPKLNTLCFDLIPSDARGADATSAQNSRAIFVISFYERDGSCHVESKIDLFQQTSPSNISSTPVRSFDVPANKSVQYVTSPIKDLPSEGIEKCITITGDIYKLRNLYQSGTGAIFSIDGTIASNIESLAYAEEIVIYGGSIDKNRSNHNLIPVNTVIYVLGSAYSEEPINIDNITQSADVISCPNTYFNNGIMPTAIQLTEAVANSTKITALGTRCVGNIKDLPINCMLVSKQTSLLVGAIEDYIERVKSVRPEGKIAIAARVSTNVTYQGELLISMPNSIKHIEGGDYFCVFMWDNDSITLDKDAWNDDMMNRYNNCKPPKLF